jgi:hypothetical protein
MTIVGTQGLSGFIGIAMVVAPANHGEPAKVGQMNPTIDDLNAFGKSLRWFHENPVCFSHLRRTPDRLHAGRGTNDQSRAIPRGSRNKFNMSGNGVKVALKS